jgi:plasmid stabilization system protein ParE
LTAVWFQRASAHGLEKDVRSSRQIYAIVYAPAALDDLDRIFDFLAETDPAAAGRPARSIASGVSALAEHPLIGCPLTDTLRALVVSFGVSGYVVLYRVRPRRVRVEVLSIRHQRGAGFS